MITRFLSSITRIAAASIVVGIIVLALKAAAWWFTGSAAFYSDAVESVVNIVTAIAALAAIRYSARPPDANHPYGHQKAEYFSVVLEGVLILGAAVMIGREALDAFLSPRVIEQPVEGVVVNVAASLINGVWCWVLLREGRERRSPALVADGRHLLTDVITSVVVVVGVLLTVVTGWLILDPIIAGLVALNILWQGWKLVRVSLGGLMDEAVPPEKLERIRNVIRGNATGALEAHDLRTRAAGRMTFIEFHMVVPGTMPVSESHGICDRIEKALRAEISEATITIHVEPEEKAKHSGVVVL